MQTIQELRNGSAVKLTTARYFTPNGRSIQAEGINPDIELSELEVKPKKKSTTVSEKDLTGHLSNPINGDAESEPTTEETDSTVEKKSGDENLSETDYQLFEALNLLKGLTIANRIQQSRG